MYTHMYLSTSTLSRGNIQSPYFTLRAHEVCTNSRSPAKAAARVSIHIAAPEFSKRHCGSIITSPHCPASVPTGSNCNQPGQTSPIRGSLYRYGCQCRTLSLDPDYTLIYISQPQQQQQQQHWSISPRQAVRQFQLHTNCTGVHHP